MVRDGVTKPGAGTTPSTPDDAAPVVAIVEVAPPVRRWLDEHGDALWRFVLGRVGSREAAEDIIQDTMLAAMAAHARFSGEASERTWLLSIAANKAADHFRAARRRPQTASPPSGDDGHDPPEPAGMFTHAGMWARPPSAWGMDASDASEKTEILAALRRCVRDLPPSLAEAVWLRDLLGIPGPEVCQTLGIAPTNLWSRMHRARSFLRSCVEKSIGIGRRGSP